MDFFICDIFGVSGRFLARPKNCDVLFTTGSCRHMYLRFVVIIVFFYGLAYLKMLWDIIESQECAWKSGTRRQSTCNPATWPESINICLGHCD